MKLKSSERKTDEKMMKEIESRLKNKNWGDLVEICPGEVRIIDIKSNEVITMTRGLWDAINSGSDEDFMEFLASIEGTVPGPRSYG